MRSAVAIAVVVVLAACGGRDAAPRPDRTKRFVANRTPQKAKIGTRPGKGTGRGTETAPATATATVAATACDRVGEPLVVASSRRVLGEATLARLGERTVVVWTEGPIGRVAIVDAQGRPGEVRDLNVAGTNAQDLTALSAGDEVFVLYKHKYGTVLEGCDLVGRRVDAQGNLSAPAVLAADVCASTYPIYRATIRGRTMFVAHTNSYEGRGVSVVRWSAGGAPIPASDPGTEELTSIRLFAPTADGLVLAWSVALQHDKWIGQLLDPEGRPVGAAERLRVYEEAALEWDGEVMIEHRMRAGALEARELPWAAGPGRWHRIDVGARARQGRIVRTGGRLWAVFEVATGGVRLLPIGPHAEAAGPPSEIGGTLVAIGGRSGATLEVRDRTRELVWQALACR